MASTMSHARVVATTPRPLSPPRSLSLSFQNLRVVVWLRSDLPVSIGPSGRDPSPNVARSCPSLGKFYTAILRREPPSFFALQSLLLENPLLHAKGSPSFT